MVRVSCRACRARVTIPDGIFEGKIRGQMGAVRCDRCGGDLDVDEAENLETAAEPAAANDSPSAPASESAAVTVRNRGQTPESEQSAGDVSESPARQGTPEAAAMTLERNARDPLPPPARVSPDPPATTPEPSAAPTPASEELPGEADWDRAPAESSTNEVQAATQSHDGAFPRLAPDLADSIWGKDAAVAGFQPVAARMLDHRPPRPKAELRNVPRAPDVAPGALASLPLLDFPTKTPYPPENWEEPSERAPVPPTALRSKPHSIPPAPVRRIGRYTVFEQFASGGMASVHLGRLYGAAEFSRVVAIKRLHPHLLEDPGFAEMFVTEARLAARVRHSNVVEILDVIADEQEIALVMEYVAGESLVALVRSAAKRGETLPLDIAAGILVGVLEGLHAAHEATDKHGQPLFIVHRDVSPHNVLVGADGVARVFDFGIAKAVETADEQTDPGMLKGKASYMAPEQIHGAPLTRTVDIFAAGVVGWELLTGRKLFGGRDNAERLYKILDGAYPRPSEFQPEIPQALDDAIMRAIARDPQDRFATAHEFAEAVEHATQVASPRAIASWVTVMAKETLAQQAEQISAVEALPPESSAPIAARIAEEALATLPPPAALPSFGPRHSAVRRPAWVLALAGIVVGALLVMVILRMTASSQTPRTDATAAALPSSTVEPLALPSAVSSAPALSPPSTPAAGPDGATPGAAGSARAPSRSRKRNSRDPQVFRPTEL